MTERKELRPEILEELKASHGASQEAQQPIDLKRMVSESKPHKVLKPFLPYKGQLFHHSGGINLFHVCLGRPGDPPENLLVLRHTRFPERYTAAVLEDLIPNYSRLNKRIGPKLHFELSTLFTREEVHEIYLAFRARFELTTSPACCDVMFGCQGQRLRIHMLSPHDASDYDWSELNTEGRLRMSFEIQAGAWPGATQND